MFSLDPRPVIRHAARKPLFVLLNNFTDSPSGIPKLVIDIIVRFSLREINEATSKHCAPVLLLCGVLSEVLPLLVPAQNATILEPLLKLASGGNPRLLVQTLTTLEALFISAHGKFRVRLAEKASGSITFNSKELTTTYQLCLQLIQVKIKLSLSHTHTYIHTLSYIF